MITELANEQVYPERTASYVSSQSTVQIYPELANEQSGTEQTKEDIDTAKE